jgi:hypothetical protein
MESTMKEIDEQEEQGVPTNRRETLKKEISDLKHGIKEAQTTSDTAEAEIYSHTPISPEQANETKKGIVFMKKNLENKQTELDKLD